MRICIMTIAVRPSRVIMPVIYVFVDGLSQISLHVVNQGVLPLVDKNAARGMKRRYDNGAGPHTRRPDDIPHQAGQVMKFFAAFSLDLNERAGYPIGSGYCLNGGLLWSSH